MTGPPRSTSAVFHLLPHGQRIETGQRIAAPFGLDRKGQVALVAVALPEMPVQRFEAPAIVLERPGGAHAMDRTVGGRPAIGGPRGIGRAVEDAEHHQRRVAFRGYDAGEFRLQKVAGLVGKIAGEPFPGLMRALCFLQGWEEVVGLVRHDDPGGLVEEHFVAGEIVAEEDEPCVRRRHGRTIQS